MLSGSSRIRALLATVAAGGLALGALAACDAKSTPTGASGDPVTVVTAFYPLQFVTERVGGDAVKVSNLTKPGAEPHDLELSPKQVAEVADAGLVVYLKGFQPAVDEAVSQQAADRSIDVAAVRSLAEAPKAEGADPNATPDAEEAALGGKDPHVWLDPMRLADIADAVAAKLGRVNAAHATDFTGRAAALRADLGKLDGEFAAGLKTCQRSDIVVSHAAFGYLAARYRLQQVAISGLTPEEEPSPQRLARVATSARQHHATTIFFETLVSPKVADAIATEVGAKTAVLDPIEGLQPGASGDYLSVMRSNLVTLKTALACS